jgi:alpha-D-ribose 1-methylphosphonate 5-triphosphate synthase subunit PhnG
MGDKAVDELLSLLADQDVRVVRQPRTGLVMMTMTDSFRTDFHLGEVLVTEAGVTVDGVEGYGMVAGDNPRRALARAAAAAILGQDTSQLRLKLTELLDREEALQRRAHITEQALTASSRVNFELMAGA